MWEIFDKNFGAKRQTKVQEIFSKSVGNYCQSMGQKCGKFQTESEKFQAKVWEIIPAEVLEISD